MTIKIHYYQNKNFAKSKVFHEFIFISDIPRPTTPTTIATTTQTIKTTTTPMTPTTIPNLYGFKKGKKYKQKNFACDAPNKCFYKIKS